MGLKTAVIGGMIGYGIAKWLDKSKTGNAVAGIGVKLVDAGLTKFHEMTQAAAERDKAAFIPSQATPEPPIIARAQEWAARLVNGAQQ